MRDLQKLAKRAMEDLDAIGVPYSKSIESFSVNTRAKSRWGQCRKRDGVYTININVELLQDSVREESALSTIIHELIHTCPSCMNHGTEWQKWAELVNDCYACYNISRCSSAEEKGVDIVAHKARQQKNYLWKLVCDDCSREWKYQRKPTRFYLDNHNNLPYAKCPCGCVGTIRLVAI